MKNTKLHKIDLIFIIGILVIAILSGFLDMFIFKDAEGGFPVFSCISIFISYALLIILLIYSAIKYKDNNNKPEYIKLYMCFLLPFLHMMFCMTGWGISSFIINIFNL